MKKIHNPSNSTIHDDKRYERETHETQDFIEKFSRTRMNNDKSVTTILENPNIKLLTSAVQAINMELNELVETNVNIFYLALF